jgi:hypothetical protein
MLHTNGERVVLQQGGCAPDARNDGGLDVQRLQRGLVELVKQVQPSQLPGGREGG